METLSTIQEDPYDVLLEFVEVLATIEVTPEKLKQNSSSMIGDDGQVIYY
jgi:hypothetical protein